jgi:hypothetical protein
MLYQNRALIKRVAVRFLFINNTNNQITGLPIKDEYEKTVRADIIGDGDVRYNSFADDNARQIDKIIVVQEHELLHNDKTRPDKVIFKNIKYKINKTLFIGNRRVRVELIEIK